MAMNARPDEAGDDSARETVEGTKPDGGAKKSADGAARKPSDAPPPAGPHADPALENAEATPGAGTLTPSGDHDKVDATSG